MDSNAPEPQPKQQPQPPPPQQQQPPPSQQQQQQQPQPTQNQQPPQQQSQPPPPPQPQQGPQPAPHPMQYHQIPHNQSHQPPPMSSVQNQPPPPPPGYMQYPPHPQAPHPHYYSHQPQQQMQPHQSPYAVQQHAGAPPPVPHHPQQPAPMYSPHATHPSHAPHPHSAAGHQQPPPHWVTHGPPPPHPQQPHPQQHPLQQHPPQQHPSHYQTTPQHQQHHAYHPYGHQPPPPPPQQTHQPQPHPMQYHQVHSQQHAPHPMAQSPYMQYSQAPHPHYYPHHQQMQPPPHQSPYAIAQPHTGGVPTIVPHPQPHPQQAGSIYSPHPPPHPHQPTHQPHWVHGPHQQAPPHPQQHLIQHPPQQIPHTPQPAYYQPAQSQAAGPTQQQLLPPASPHHPPSRTHTPQHPPTSQTPTRVPSHSSTPASPSNVPKPEKKDITFPKNSVEATKPVASKKRKITSKDVTDIEVWRLLMCLKSGLLAESSWAIDVLSILLNDDSTLMYFGLQHTPGLLEAVLEHFKCCLNELFAGMVSDTTLKPVLNKVKPVDKVHIKNENGICNSNNNNNHSVTNNNINGLNNETIASKAVINKRKINGVIENMSSSIKISSLGDQIIMFNSSKNYTHKTRDGRIVRLKNGVTPMQEEPTYELVFEPVGYSHWQEGNGEDTSHIQVYFQPNNFIESSRRCTCLSTIIRNLSFIPGNDVEMSRHAGLLLVLGRLLLLKHDDVVHNEADSAPNEWHLLNSLREDTLVIISNISSSLDLSPYNDKINLSLLDGLLHWACCSSSYALDPFPAPSITVSPQRLALESLAKLSIIEGNVDLILATPPWSRIEKLFEVLARLLNVNEDQTIREFSLVLLSNLTSADSGIARKVALTGSAIPRLISFLELSLADLETFSTTQDMLRRAALTLKCLSQLVDNHPLFAQHQQRLLNLVMSQKLDPEVMPIIADVIFEISLSD